MAEQQRIVRFHGNVQGVGFRYTACRTAGSYDVTGYVRNLPDGTVECVAEGPAEEVEGFFEELSRRMSGYIERQTSQTAPPGGRFDTFGVKY